MAYCSHSRCLLPIFGCPTIGHSDFGQFDLCYHRSQLIADKLWNRLAFHQKTGYEDRIIRRIVHYEGVS